MGEGSQESRSKPLEEIHSPSSAWQGGAGRINGHLALSCLPPGSLCHQELSPPVVVVVGWGQRPERCSLPRAMQLETHAHPCVRCRPS